MEYREIMYIRTITKCKSITKAADSLYIAQPSLSQALHRVEEYYGAEFFWRTKAGLVITDAGKAYLEAADKMEKLYNEAKEELKNGRGTQFDPRIVDVFLTILHEYDRVQEKIAWTYATIPQDSSSPQLP